MSIDERRERYAAPLFEIMRQNGWDGERTERGDRDVFAVVDAAMAVADEEHAELSGQVWRAAALEARVRELETNRAARDRRITDLETEAALLRWALSMVPRIYGPGRLEMYQTGGRWAVWDPGRSGSEGGPLVETVDDVTAALARARELAGEGS